MSSQALWIKSKAKDSLNPAQVETTLNALAAAWNGPLSEFLRDFPLGEEALIHLLAVSQICAERLQRVPELLRWLARPEISMSDRGPRRMRAELQSSSESIPAENFRALRLWKAREMTRIALREVAEASSLEDTTAELSCLAGVCLETVYEECDTRLRTRLGEPRTEFTVFGLGKLGGRELNHSSDIDLMFVYGEEGQGRLSNHEWHNQLAAQIVKSFSGGEPALFRLDLRLRPEGSAGPLARSLESMENYYAGFGETWERLALIKARRVCGSNELAYEFLRQHQPFIFPKNPTPELLDEIAAIKRRIEREIPADELDVKLGAGGIREIEFVVQTLQFIHGAKQAFLQEQGTLKALHAIAQLELLPTSEVRVLDDSYRFLRRIEHRLQIEAERQTHSIPDDPVKRERLARSLGFDSGDAFLAEVKANNERVQEIFDRLVASGTATPAVNLNIFADTARATRTLNDLAQGSVSFHVAPRTRQIFRRLRPLLLEELAACADPDATLIAIVRFVEAFGLRSLLFELLATNPKLLELLVRTFDASFFATNVLVRHPHLLEEITRSATLNRSLSLSEHVTALHPFVECGDLDAIRVYRQTQLLRTTMRDVLGLSELTDLWQEITDIAEACLLAAAAIAGANNLTIVGMGKFGGRELTYASDLDLMFVGDDFRAAQNLITALSIPSPEGVIATIDARLRPEGEKGPLVSSIEAFEAYYRERAQLWEIQALTRARPVTGPDQESFRTIAHAAWSVAGRDPDLFEKIDAMLHRVRAERGSGSDALDFKTGVGGIIEAEFLVQALQMRNDVREPSVRLAIMKLAGIISSEDVDLLGRHYEFLRQLETVLRRRRNISVSSLPADPTEQRKLAIGMEFKDRETWQEQCERARADIHGIYDKYFRSTS
jgi:[glutamine synthetase] adenylyltransferase / [glutamine synthetase]-adenylyl-L-tyrosine phosphorylase